jgi:hypothetical protein
MADDSDQLDGSLAMAEVVVVEVPDALFHDLIALFQDFRPTNVFGKVFWLELTHWMSLFLVVLLLFVLELDHQITKLVKVNVLSHNTLELFLIHAFHLPNHLHRILIKEFEIFIYHILCSVYLLHDHLD